MEVLTLRVQVQPAAEDFVFRQLEAGHVAVRRFAAHLVASVSYAKPIPQHLQASIRKPSMRSRKLRDLDVHRDVRAEEADGGSHATQSAFAKHWEMER